MQNNFLDLFVVKTIRGESEIQSAKNNGQSLVLKSKNEAYILHPRLRIGQKVFIEDIIERIVKHTIKYTGKSNKTESEFYTQCEAIWNGEDLELMVKPPIEKMVFTD